MANKDVQYKGSIDLSDFTTTAYLPAKGELITFNSFKSSGKSVLQMGSADLSGAVTATLQVSGDGNYWANAQEDGSDVTFSISTTTPIVEILVGEEQLMFRVAVTIGGQTGTIDYYIRDID